MKLEKLFLELSKNPNVIQDIEIEMKIIINSESLEQVYQLFKSPILEMRIYAIKILEERIKIKKIKNEILDKEITAMKNIILIDNSDKSAEVFAKLGIFEWPLKFPDFFQIILDLVSTKKEMGYKILYSFLYQINYSQEINDKRKNELKKGLGIIYKGYMQLFEDEFAGYIIPILTESLKIIPKDFDYSIIYRRGFDFPEKTLEFINEMNEKLNVEDVIDLACKMPISVGMLIYFNGLKNKSPNISNISKLYEYVYKGLRYNMSTFSISLDFWIKFFCTKNKEQFIDQILTEVVSIFVNLDEQNKSEAESEVYGFFNVLLKNYTEKMFSFIKDNGDLLPKKISLFFIRKVHDQIQKNPNLKSLNLHELVFKDAILNGTVLELNNDQRVVDFIPFLDLSDKESSKLCIKVIRKFTLPESFFNTIINMCLSTGKEPANEVIVECCIKLDRIERFDDVWDTDKFIRFFYYLKRVPMKVCQYSNNYLQVFMEQSPFDRCFSILKMLGVFSKEVYEKIYNDIFSYPYEDLNCFNRDLLVFLELQDPFIRREIDRILHDWTRLENNESLLLCTKSLLSVFSEGITKSNLKNASYPSIDSLFDLLRIDDAGIIRKISEIFYSYNGSYDVKKALYFFLLNYNSSYVESSHLSISAAITKCIKTEGGAEALHEILNGIPIEACMNLKKDCLSYNTKRSQTLVRNFLHDFKGKPLCTLYEDNFKVSEQNFINNTTKSIGFDFEIDKTFFS